MHAHEIDELLKLCPKGYFQRKISRGWMFRRLRSLFGKKPQRQPLEANFAYRFSSADAGYIEQALNLLPTIGLQPTLPPEKFREKSEEIAAEHEGVFCIRKPTLLNWILFALSGEQAAFSNAMHLGDHCYDGMTSPDLADMIRAIVKMASDDWPIDDVEVIDPSHEFESASCADIQIVASPAVPPFRLELGKNFDWTLIYRLNERLPQRLTKKFAILLDGNATIVYLEPEQIEKLNEYCELGFVYEE